MVTALLARGVVAALRNDKGETALDLAQSQFDTLESSKVFTDDICSLDSITTQSGETSSALVKDRRYDEALELVLPYSPFVGEGAANGPMGIYSYYDLQAYLQNLRDFARMVDLLREAQQS